MVARRVRPGVSPRRTRRRPPSIRAPPRSGHASGPRIGVVGIGYVGLATGLAFAEYGRPVVGYDTSSRRRDELRRGECPIYEPGLPALLRRALRTGRFRVVDSLDQVVREADLLYLCVPTPSRSDGSVDLSYVGEAARSVGEALRSVRGWRAVILKSTAVPGTTLEVVKPAVLAAGPRGTGDPVGFGANPEFLAEGTLVQDALRPSRIVLGAEDPRTLRALRRAFRGFPGERVTLSPTAAELVKYVANAMLATRVSFSNEMARVAGSIGVDVYPVLDAVGLDPRIGRLFLRAGPGFGGSCFGKDLRALVAFAASKGLPLEIGRSVLSVNAAQAHHVVDLADRAAGGLRGRRVAVLGLAFKPGTLDVRESQAYPIVYELLHRGASVRLHDPRAIEPFREGFDPDVARQAGDRLAYRPSLASAVEDSDLAILHDDWEEYRRAPDRLWAGLGLRLVVDARRTLDPKRLERHGVRYVAVGR